MIVYLLLVSVFCLVKVSHSLSAPITSTPPHSELLRGWYDGNSFDLKTGDWMDKSGNNRHTMATFGTSFRNIMHKFPNDQKHAIIKGTPTDRLVFPTDLFEHTHQIFCPTQTVTKMYPKMTISEIRGVVG